MEGGGGGGACEQQVGLLLVSLKIVTNHFSLS